MVDAGAKEVQNVLSKVLGLDLAATVLFDYPTINGLTAHLVQLATATNAERLPSLKTISSSMQSATRGAAQVARLEQQIIAMVQQVVGSVVSPYTPLAAAGIDSLAAVELRNELSR